MKTDPHVTQGTRILVIPRSTKISTEDRAALKDADIAVVTVDDPSQVRLLTGEPMPFTSNDMLRAAIVGLADSWESSKARAWNALAKIVGGETVK